MIKMELVQGLQPQRDEESNPLNVRESHQG